MRKYFCCCICLLLSFQTLTAQVFGGNPSFLKWKQINTDSFRIIFPEGLDSAAFNVASLIRFQQRNIAETIGERQRKVNIVLQNQITYSNGYVGLAPFRSEFYLMPPTDVSQLGAQNWTDNLAVHEYRHVEQYNNFDVGLSHVFKIIFGENGQAFANAAAVPDWFFEGDAVYNETLLSRQGRGRIPFFMNAFKSLYLGNKQYNYQKIRNGSYKGFVPNWYNLGYILVDYGYAKYGTDFWKNVTHDAAAFKGLFYPLQRGIKTYAGLSFKDFRDSAFNYYKRQWMNEPADTLHYLTETQKRNVVNYQFPYPAKDGSIIALKSDYRHVPTFVLLYKDGTEKSIAVRPAAYDDYFGYNNGNIVYAFRKPDVRWGYKESSDIEVLDIASHKKITVTHHKRYFTPDISHNGKSIAATAFTTDQQSSVDVLDFRGNIVKHFPADKNHVYSFPKFSEDDKHLFVIERNKAGEMAMRQFDIETGEEKIILPFGNRLIDFPVVRNDTLFFTCTQNGADESWAHVSGGQKVYKVAKTRLGIYQSFMQNDSLTGSVFTADGYRLAKIKAAFRPITDANADTLTRVYNPVPKKDYSYVFDNIVPDSFSVTRYPKLHHPVNFHSLQPDFDDPDYSLTLYGENVLNTLQTDLSYTYNRIERYHALSLGTVYGGSFIEPFLNGSYIFDRTAYDSKGNRNIHFSDAGWQAGLQLPLNFSSGKFYRYFTYAASFNQRFINWSDHDLGLKNRSANYLTDQVSFSNQCQSASQQLFPHFAQSVSLLMRNTLDDNAAWQLLAKGSLYLPGILPTHSFYINAAWQKQDTSGRYSFGYSFPFSRGYDLFSFRQMWKYGLNYTLPIVYPDFGFANILYIKRISANAFYDNTFGKNYKTATQNFASCGAELSFDINVWNQEATGITIRYSRLLNNLFASRNRWEVFLPVSLF